MASAEKKAAHVVVALVVTDMITTSISLEQAQAEAVAIKPVGVLDPAPVLQETQGAKGEGQSKEV